MKVAAFIIPMIDSHRIFSYILIFLFCPFLVLSAQTTSELKQLLLLAPFREVQISKWTVEQKTFRDASLRAQEKAAIESKIEELQQSGHASDSPEVQNERSHMESLQKLPNPFVETIDVEFGSISPSKWRIGVYPRQMERDRGREYSADGDGLVYQVDRGSRMIEITDTAYDTLSDVLRGLPQFFALGTLPLAEPTNIKISQTGEAVSLRYSHPLYEGEILVDLDPSSFSVYKVTEMIGGKTSRIVEKTEEGFLCTQYDLNSGETAQTQKWKLVSSATNQVESIVTKPNITDGFGVNIKTSKISIQGLDSADIANKKFLLKDVK